MGMGLTAEVVADACSIDRTDMEKFAVTSHEKAMKGDFSDEIIPIDTGKGGIVSEDGCIRSDTNLEALAGLKTPFKAGGKVTAGTSSPLTDGAAAVLVCSESFAKANNLDIIARIKATAVTGLKPEVMGLGPVGASQKALERAGLKIGDIDVAEINEAFAAQALPCMAQIGIDAAKVNMEGGAIAIGHPLGASGARITGKAALLMNKHKGKYALSSMCIGGGQGIATVLEAV